MFLLLLLLLLWLLFLVVFRYVVSFFCFYVFLLLGGWLLCVCCFFFSFFFLFMHNFGRHCRYRLPSHTLHARSSAIWCFVFIHWLHSIFSIFIAWKLMLESSIHKISTISMYRNLCCCRCCWLCPTVHSCTDVAHFAPYLCYLCQWFT